MEGSVLCMVVSMWCDLGLIRQRGDGTYETESQVTVKELERSTSSPFLGEVTSRASEKLDDCIGELTGKIRV